MLLEAGSSLSEKPGLKLVPKCRTSQVLMLVLLIRLKFFDGRTSGSCFLLMTITWREKKEALSCYLFSDASLPWVCSMGTVGESDINVRHKLLMFCQKNSTRVRPIIVQIYQNSFPLLNEMYS